MRAAQKIFWLLDKGTGHGDRLEPLTGVRTYPARVKCATLAWHTFDAALKTGAQDPGSRSLGPFGAAGVW